VYNITKRGFLSKIRQHSNVQFYPLQKPIFIAAYGYKTLDR
jgi:hypothetical protein